MNVTRRELNGAIIGSSISFLFSNGSLGTTNPAIWQTTQGNAARTGSCQLSQDVIKRGRAWEVDFESDIRATPVVSDGAVIVATTDGRVAAFELNDGTKRWERNGTAEIKRPPALDSEYAYVHLNEKSIHALDIQTGETEWRIEFEYSLEHHTGLAVVDDVLYFSTGEVHAIDCRSGEILWQVSPEMGRPLGFAIQDGTVFVTTPLDIEAIAAKDGSQQWMGDIEALSWGAPTVGDHAYSRVGPPNVIMAVSKDTGEEQWMTTVTDEPLDTLALSPIVTDESLIVADEEGNVAAITEADGSARWRHSVEGSLVHHPVACGETVYLPAEEEIIALSMSSGDVEWRVQVGERPTSPALVDDQLVVTTLDGKLIALGDEPRLLDQWATGIGAGIAGLAGLGGYGAYRYYSSRKSMGQD